MAEALAMVDNGELLDGKSIAALMLALRKGLLGGGGLGAAGLAGDGLRGD